MNPTKLNDCPAGHPPCPGKEGQRLRQPGNCVRNRTLTGKQASSQLTILKKQGLVESPLRCRYSVTEAGKKAAS